MINRDTGLLPRFFSSDARLTALIFIWFYHMRMWTTIMLVIAFLFFFILERYGITINASWWAVKNFIAGRYREISLHQGEWGDI